MIAFLQGMGTSAGLIVAIGAQNAFVLSQGVSRQYHWMVATICTICDGLLIFLGASGVGTVVARHQLLQQGAAWGGAIFLFWYGLRSLRSALSSASLTADAARFTSRRAVVMATLAVTLLNPHVYLDTLLLLGSISGQFDGSGRLYFAIGASLSSLMWFYCLSLGGVILSPVLQRPTIWRGLNLLICLTMWSIAVQLLLFSLGPIIS
jgi:L-lysine exporter family protein LysE/ArgO